MLVLSEMEGVTIFTDTPLDNYSTIFSTNSSENISGMINLYPFSIVLPFTIIYVMIFIMGVIGNISTCVVIAKNKSMQTATNYYLFSLACSDLLLLLSGLPPEMYRIWSPDRYIFGEVCCIIQGLAAETSANATVLTITAFTAERYVAICHPFVSHTWSKPSRAVKFVIGIWVISLTLAIPQAIQFGVIEEIDNGVTTTHCTVINNFFDHAFEISTFIIFVGPMSLITVLYVLIGMQLRKSRNIGPVRPKSRKGEKEPEEFGRKSDKDDSAQKRVVNMLVAVVVAFFVCWAPFHTQRLLAVYLSTASSETQERFFNFYLYLMYTSGVLYFVSTTVNPVLYHIMSKKFRNAFKYYRVIHIGLKPAKYMKIWKQYMKDTFVELCGCGKPNKGHYASIRKVPLSMRHIERSISEVADLSPNLVEANSDMENSSQSRVPNSTQTSSLSSFRRSTSHHDPCRLKPAENRNGNREENREHFLNLPFGLSKIFVRADSNRSSNTANISNSSLRDTDVSEFIQSDPVDYMVEMNENIQ